MKFLIDNALSPQVSAGLLANGHDSVHVRDYGMAAATDDVILLRALDEGRTVVSADTDFGTLLARNGWPKPSVVLFRGETNRRHGRRIRVRQLPISR